MSYKIAIGSSDGIHVNLKFGEVQKFLIYEVDSDIKLMEERSITEDNIKCKDIFIQEQEKRCDEGKNCNHGCSGQGGGCGGSEILMSKVSIIEDCRCVVCKKVGFQAQKQFEKKAISVFDVECLVSEALEKITFYYKKIDNHESFRKD